MERNFLTAFDTANSARYLFSKLVRLPLMPRYFVKYHTLSGGVEGEGHFCRRVKRSLLGEREREKKKTEKEKLVRRVFYGSIGRLTKGPLSGIGSMENSLILRSIKIDPSPVAEFPFLRLQKRKQREPISSFLSHPCVTSHSNNTVPLGLSFLLNNLQVTA